MAQNRPPPAFQEYAAATMASTHYRVMSLAERGLMYSMRLECWVNTGLPENPATIAKILGFSFEDVKAALPGVMPLFANHGGMIICPELEDYRAHLKGIREKQSNGGKRGAEITNSKQPTERKDGASDSAGDSAGDSRLTRRVTDGSLVKPSPVHLNQNQQSGSGIAIDPWLEDFDSTPFEVAHSTTPDAYKKASGK
ncbi:MAG: hypothetical protein Q8O38_16580 [Sulfurimicrobium sp.]|nr:hypothetical protein [Sulfurimicrobium sp.]